MEFNLEIYELSSILFANCKLKELEIECSGYKTDADENLIN